MASGFRGVGAGQDVRFTDKDKKLLKSMKFPKEYEEKIDLKPVNWEAIKGWVAKRATELLGIEDEVLIAYIFEQIDGMTQLDPRMLQISLTGFLEKNASLFVKELWGLLASASKNPSGVPQRLLDEKAEELRKKKETQDRINENLAKERKRREEEDREERKQEEASRRARRHSREAAEREEAERRRAARERDLQEREKTRDRARRDAERDRDLRDRERGGRDRDRERRDYDPRDRDRDVRDRGRDHDRDRHRDREPRRDPPRDLPLPPPPPRHAVREESPVREGHERPTKRSRSPSLGNGAPMQTSPTADKPGAGPEGSGDPEETPKKDKKAKKEKRGKKDKKAKKARKKARAEARQGASSGDSSSGEEAARQRESQNIDELRQLALRSLSKS